MDDALSLNLLQGSLYLSKLLITKLYTCIYMYLYVLYVKSNQSNHTNWCKYCDFHVIILSIMGVFNWQINIFYSILLLLDLLFLDTNKYNFPSPHVLNGLFSKKSQIISLYVKSWLVLTRVYIKQYHYEITRYHTLRMWEKFKNTKGVISSQKSKDRQYNDKKGQTIICKTLHS